MGTIYCSLHGYKLLYNRTDNIDFRSDDGFRWIVAQTVHLFIDPVNDAPVLTVPDAPDTDEDTPLVLTLEATDVDEDDLIFSAYSEHPENVAAEVTGNQLTLSPVQDWQWHCKYCCVGQ
jgi:hypothetical protein